jgi:hypothetical protein
MDGKYVGCLWCKKIYPQDMSYSTIGMRLDKGQAIDLAVLLLKAVRKDGDIIDVTGQKKNQRKRDGAYQVTVKKP